MRGSYNGLQIELGKSTSTPPRKLALLDLPRTGAPFGVRVIAGTGVEVGAPNRSVSIETGLEQEVEGAAAEGDGLRSGKCGHCQVVVSGGEGVDREG